MIILDVVLYPLSLLQKTHPGTLIINIIAYAFIYTHLQVKNLKWMLMNYNK